ncbi:MAG TPA: oxygenase MpaB family protein, partial [Allosphingosinicella sp.]|nr:oxygenase MpaB family protein [Allosphingosinicella sp.]
MSKALLLPRPLQRSVEGFASGFLSPADAPAPDFRNPPGEPALVPPDSVSWRIFKNPLTLFVGGVAAVLLELAEPRVRHGVWDHTSFRTDPIRRLQRTGLAAMVTIYGPASAARAMIGSVNRMHSMVSGRTDAGAAYRADDPELLDWVQATAAFGFLEA